MTRKAGYIYTVFFLLYFVFYMVAPFSMALPKLLLEVSAGNIFEETAETFYSLAESPVVKKQKFDRVDPFIFDMALWKILEKGKPSDASSRNKLVVRKTGPENFSAKIMSCLTESAILAPLPFPEAISGVLTDHILFHINTPLLYSGLSPPLA